MSRVKRVKQMRKWRGQVPQNSRLVELCRVGGVWWALFARDCKLGWQNFKVAADRALGRANYWLGWDPVRRKVANWPDARALREQQPVVNDWALAVMDGYDPSGSVSIIVCDYDRPDESNSVWRVAPDRVPRDAIYVAEIIEALGFHSLCSTPIGDETEASVARDRGSYPLCITRGRNPSRDGLDDDSVDDLI